MNSDPRKEKGFVRIKKRDGFFMFLKVVEEYVSGTHRWITTWVDSLSEATVLSDDEAYRWIGDLWPDEAKLSDEYRNDPCRVMEIGFVAVGQKKEA